MLQLKIPASQMFNEATMQFIDIPECTLQLEHSLVSLTKWESKWHVPFLTRQGHTWEQSIDYVRCMTLNKNVDPLVYKGITQALFKKVTEYIQAPMTATTFKTNRGGGRQIITSQIIYYWMIQNNIPFECQKWHLNRLMTLIRVCGESNAPQKKMSAKDIAHQNRELNAARRAKARSRG